MQEKKEKERRGKKTRERERALEKKKKKKKEKKRKEKKRKEKKRKEKKRKEKKRKEKGKKKEQERKLPRELWPLCEKKDANKLEMSTRKQVFPKESTAKIYDHTLPLFKSSLFIIFHCFEVVKIIFQ